MNEAGAPAAGAEVVAVQVSVLRQPKVSARADASGRFRIPVEVCGQVVLKASGRDFAPSFLNVEACNGSPEHRIVLRPGITASGRIVGADGRPVSGAWVELIGSSSQAFQEPGPYRARTGQDGRFSLSGLLPGVYALRVAHPEHPRLHQPGIDVPEGKPRIDIGGFSLAKAQRVEGQVVDQEGRPVAGVRILQARSGPLERAAAPTTGPDGRFVLPELVFGRLTLCKEGYDSSWGPMASPSQPSRLARIVLRPAPPPLRLTGRVLDGEGRPVAGARVRSGPHQNGCVIATFIDGCTGEVIPDPATVADAEGRFSLEIRVRGDLDVKAEATGYVPAVKSRVPAGQSAEIELVLRRSVTVTGRVLAKDGSPAASARVTLFANPRSPAAVADAQGRFRLEELAPGRQVFEAKHPDLGRAFRRLEVSPDARSLDLRLDGVPEQGPAARREPSPEQRISLAGHLLGVEDPAHLATGQVEARKGEDYRRTEVTREGRYRLRDLSPGEWTVTAHAQGRHGDTRVVLELGQEEVFLDLEIPRYFEIRGRVLEPDGTPAIAQVKVIPSGKGGYFTVSSDAEGRFSFEAPAGTYAVLATHAQYAPVRLEPVTVAGPLDGLEIPLRPGLTLTGRIPGLPDGVHASIQAVQEGVSRSTQAGPDGAYRFDNLGPGEWRLTVRVSGEGFYREGKGSVVLSPETAGRFDFDLALGSASLSGRLGSDEEPVFASVELLNAEGDQVAVTGVGFLDGEFRFPHLRPGGYILRITEQSSGRVFTRAVKISGDQEIGIDTLE